MLMDISLGVISKQGTGKTRASLKTLNSYSIYFWILKYLTLGTLFLQWILLKWHCSDLQYYQVFHIRHVNTINSIVTRKTHVKNMSIYAVFIFMDIPQYIEEGKTSSPQLISKIKNINVKLSKAYTDG